MVRQGSEAASPQREQSIPWWRAALATSFTILSTAGCAEEYRLATESLPRSTAKTYWVRSLVPMEKKSTSRAKLEAIRAALGTSIIMPTGKSRL